MSTAAAAVKTTIRARVCDKKREGIPAVSVRGQFGCLSAPGMSGIQIRIVAGPRLAQW